MMQGNAGPTYTVPLTTTSLTTANGWDILTVTADSSARLEVVEVNLAFASTQFASGSGLALQFLRGSTAASTGASITPRNIKGHPSPPSAAFTAAGPSSGLVSTASAVLLYSDAFDFRGRLSYRPKDREERISLTLGQRLNLRVGTPQIAVTITGSVLLSETGKGLPS
jgi:hypothetical protein